MEYSLTEFKRSGVMSGICLNPYSNGILTDYCYVPKMIGRFDCLNPYSNGILTDRC